MIVGTKMRIIVDGKPIFHETEASLSSSISFSEVASKDTNGVKVMPGNQSWGISASSLTAVDPDSLKEDVVTMYAKHEGKQIVQVQFTTDEAGDIVFTGNAYVETFDIAANNGETVTGSFSFKGDESLSLGVVAS